MSNAKELTDKLSLMLAVFKEMRAYVEDVGGHADSPDLCAENELYVTPADGGEVLRIVVEPVLEGEFPRWVNVGEKLLPGDEARVRVLRKGHPPAVEFLPVPASLVGTNNRIHHKFRRRRPTKGAET